MTEEEKNIEWICSRTLLDKNDELVPIILKMLSETYINGLKQGHFDRDMDIQKQQKEIEKKDKIIDLMAEQLAKLREDGREDCFINQDINVCVTKYKTCEKCIKQYFEKKVEENK